MSEKILTCSPHFRTIVAPGLILLFVGWFCVCGLQAQQGNVVARQAGDAEPTKNTSSPATSANDVQVKRIWRVGANLRGASRSVSNILITFPVPTDWPEQHVNLYKENIPTEARRAEFRDSDGVRQMVATIPRLDAGANVDINVLMEITVRGVAYPTRTDNLVIPKRPPRDVRLCLNPSPLIESRDRSIRKQIKEIVDKTDTPWEQVRAIYTWVNSNVTIKKGKVLGATETLDSKTGPAEDLCNLFIALCRIHKVPARMVWADNGEYTEFYLQDETGAGKWYPVVLDGNKEFGQMSHPRVIIQKGDNIKVPEKGPRQRFVVEFITGSGKNGAQPRVRFLRDLLPSRDAK